MGSLSGEKKKIYELFLDKENLRFSDIEKSVKIRSNKLTYHLVQMQKSGILQKKGFYYSLTKKGEKYLPVFSQVSSEESGPIVVVLIALVNKDKILMIHRNRRPYKNYWAMIGGKIMHSESIEEAGYRLIKEKTGLKSKLVSINTMMHEQVMEDSSTKHSFFIYFIKMKTSENKFRESSYGKLKWFRIKEFNKIDIVPSDLWLIKNKLDSKADLHKCHIEESEGKIISHIIKH